MSRDPEPTALLIVLASTPMTASSRRSVVSTLLLSRLRLVRGARSSQWPLISGLRTGCRTRRGRAGRSPRPRNRPLAAGSVPRRELSARPPADGTHPPARPCTNATAQDDPLNPRIDRLQPDLPLEGNVLRRPSRQGRAAPRFQLSTTTTTQHDPLDPRIDRRRPDLRIEGNVPRNTSLPRPHLPIGELGPSLAGCADRSRRPQSQSLEAPSAPRTDRLAQHPRVARSSRATPGGHACAG